MPPLFHNGNGSDAGVGPAQVTAADSDRRIVTIQNAQPLVGGFRQWYGFDVNGVFGATPDLVVKADGTVGFFLDPGGSRVMKLVDHPEVTSALYCVAEGGTLKFVAQARSLEGGQPGT